MGPRAACAHECDGLWLGVDGRNGDRDLADGAAVSDSPATPAFACGRRWILEFGRVARSGRNSLGRQHWLPMARVSVLCRDRSFRRLHTRCFVGGADVSLSARRTDLHYAMVFARRVSLVSMALRGRAVDALRRAGPGSLAIGSGLVVRK